MEQKTVTKPLRVKKGGIQKKVKEKKLQQKKLKKAATLLKKKDQSLHGTKSNSNNSSKKVAITRSLRANENSSPKTKKIGSWKHKQMPYVQLPFQPFEYGNINYNPNYVQTSSIGVPQGYTSIQFPSRIKDRRTRQFQPFQYANTHYNPNYVAASFVGVPQGIRFPSRIKDFRQTRQFHAFEYTNINYNPNYVRASSIGIPQGYTGIRFPPRIKYDRRARQFQPFEYANISYNPNYVQASSVGFPQDKSKKRLRKLKRSANESSKHKLKKSDPKHKRTLYFCFPSDVKDKKEVKKLHRGIENVHFPRRSKRGCFITFESEELAVRALKTLNHSKVEGGRLLVKKTKLGIKHSLQKQNPPKKQNHRIYVTNLPVNTKWKDLQSTFPRAKKYHLLKDKTSAVIIFRNKKLVESILNDTKKHFVCGVKVHVRDSMPGIIGNPNKTIQKKQKSKLKSGIPKNDSDDEKSDSGVDDGDEDDDDDDDDDDESTEEDSDDDDDDDDIESVEEDSDDDDDIDIESAEEDSDDDIDIESAEEDSDDDDNNDESAEQNSDGQDNSEDANSSGSMTDSDGKGEDDSEIEISADNNDDDGYIVYAEKDSDDKSESDNEKGAEHSDSEKSMSCVNDDEVAGEDSVDGISESNYGKSVEDMSDKDSESDSYKDAEQNSDGVDNSDNANSVSSMTDNDEKGKENIKVEIPVDDIESANEDSYGNKSESDNENYVERSDDEISKSTESDEIAGVDSVYGISDLNFLKSVKEDTSDKDTESDN